MQGLSKDWSDRRARMSATASKTRHARNREKYARDKEVEEAAVVAKAKEAKDCKRRVRNFFVQLRKMQEKHGAETDEFKAEFMKQSSKKARCCNYNIVAWAIFLLV